MNIINLLLLYVMYNKSFVVLGKELRKLLLGKASKEEMKKEAIERLKMLNVHKNVLNEFIIENILNKSEGKNGILYWLSDKEQEKVKEYEEKWNVLVYHVIKTYTLDLGILYDLLYITNKKEYWEDERKRLKNELVLSHTIGPFEESGDIVVKQVNGGVVRAY